MAALLPGSRSRRSAFASVLARSAFGLASIFPNPALLYGPTSWMIRRQRGSPHLVRNIARLFIGTSMTGAVMGIAIPTYQLWNQPVEEIERRSDKFDPWNSDRYRYPMIGAVFYAHMIPALLPKRAPLRLLVLGGACLGAELGAQVQALKSQVWSEIWSEDTSQHSTSKSAQGDNSRRRP